MKRILLTLCIAGALVACSEDKPKQKEPQTTKQAQQPCPTTTTLDLLGLGIAETGWQPDTAIVQQNGPQQVMVQLINKPTTPMPALWKQMPEGQFLVQFTLERKDGKALTPGTYKAFDNQDSTQVLLMNLKLTNNKGTMLWKPETSKIQLYNTQKGLCGTLQAKGKGSLDGKTGSLKGTFKVD